MMVWITLYYVLVCAFLFKVTKHEWKKFVIELN